jgi:hypothetical protein
MRLRDTDYINQEGQQAHLRDTLNYDPCTGAFTWRGPKPGVRSGDVAGHINESGRVVIRLFGRQYHAHYLAWLYVEGQWPSGQIVHLNGDTTDNRYINLREVPKAERKHPPKARRRQSQMDRHYSVELTR